MKELRIPKRNGTYRVVVCPTNKEKQINRQLIPRLTSLMLLLDTHKVAHGFVPTRSPVTNAKFHVGYQYSLCFDLKDFFDSVTTRLILDNRLKKLIYQVIGHHNKGLVFHKETARQGLPTSPLMANIAFSVADKRIMQLVERLQERGYRIVYTRYADDLTFSFDDPKLIKRLRRFMTLCCQKFGFQINHKKTCCQWAKNGRRNITGVMVDHEKIYPKLGIRRRLRAAIHRKRHKQINGLGEWCKLKEPQWGQTVADLLAGGNQEQLRAMMIRDLHM